MRPTNELRTPHGTFPFGRPITTRDARHPKTSPAKAAILGVYPSAVHVSWTRDGRTIAALAVDDEPVPFWEGEREAKPRSDWLDAWREAVGWRDAWGTVGWSGNNGFSGRPVRNEVLAPLGLSFDEVLVTDCLNHYFAKDDGEHSQRKAIEAYNQVALELGAPLADVPERPSPAKLVERASLEHRARLREELRNGGAPRVITLGQEAADVLQRIADEGERSARRVLARDRDYGRPRELRLDGATLEWVALVHPGGRRGEWETVHEQWKREVAPGLR